MSLTPALSELTWLLARCGKGLAQRCAHQQALPTTPASSLNSLLMRPYTTWGVCSNGWHRSTQPLPDPQACSPPGQPASSLLSQGTPSWPGLKPCRSLATASAPSKHSKKEEGPEATGPKVTTSAPWPWIDETKPYVLPKWVGLDKVPPVSIQQAISQVKDEVASCASQLPKQFALSGRKRRVQPSSRDSVELNLIFLTDPRRSDQIVRGMVAMPNGTGKTRRIAVFAKGAAAEAARAQGADVIGDEALIQKIIETDGEVIDFEVLIATPEFAKPLAKAGKVLGPKGLMPNPKLGTLTDDVAAAVKEMQAGKLEFRVGRDKQLQILIGKVHFTDQALLDNAGALVNALVQLRPKSLPGSGIQGYISNAYLKSSHTPTVRVDPLSFEPLIQATSDEGTPGGKAPASQGAEANAGSQ